MDVDVVGDADFVWIHDACRVQILLAQRYVLLEVLDICDLRLVNGLDTFAGMTMMDGSDQSRHPSSSASIAL